MMFLRLLTFIPCVLVGLLLGAQDWEPMDKGFEQIGNGFSVYRIKVNPNTHRLFVGGYLNKDGRGRSIRGVTSWDSQSNLWDTLYSPNTATVRAFDFYQGQLNAQSFFSVESFFDDQTFHTWDNGTWVVDSLGPGGTVYNSAVIDDKLYMVGSFDQVGGLPSYGIAIYDGTTFTPYFGQYADNFPWIEDIIEFRDEIYLTGQTMTGAPDFEWRGLAKMGEEELEVAHEQFTGTFFQMWPHCLEVFQDELYIGGLFNTDLGFSGNGIQRFDGINMHEVGGGFNRQVFDMKVYKGELYVVGGFTGLGYDATWNTDEGEPCMGVAKWDGETWTCLNQHIPETGWFRTLEVYNDTLYVGGSFTNLAGDSAMTMIARKRIYPKAGVDNFSGFALFPNPTNGQVTLDFGYLLGREVKVDIYNTIGQHISSLTLEPWSQQYQLALPNAEGLYLIQIRLGDLVLTERILRLN